MSKETDIFYVSKTILVVSTLCCLLVACSFPGLLSSSSFDSDEISAQKATIAMRMTETGEAENAPTLTPRPPTATATLEVQCAFVWTLKQDDDLSALFRANLSEDVRKSSGLGVVWYGENCIDQNTNSLVRFYPANLDITVMFEGNEDKTEQWLGDQIHSIMVGIEEGLLKRVDLEGYPITMHFVYEIDGKKYISGF